MSASGTGLREARRDGIRRRLQDGVAAGGRPERDCLCWTEADTPVRLRPSDLQNPDDFHRRLTQWLMAQG